MSNHEMLQLIEKKRIELNEVVLQNGLNSAVTIKFSQELDRLLNQYNNFMLQKN